MRKEQNNLELTSSLEKIIVSSAMYYPQYIEEFLAQIPLSALSKEGQECLKTFALAFEKKEPINIEILTTKLGNAFVQSEYFKSVVDADIVPEWINLTNTFRQDLLLKTQRKIALELLSDCDKGQVTDIETLSAKNSFVSNECKSLREWEAHYNSLPLLPKIKSGIDFLDVCFDGGFELGQLVLISGDPEAGKTMLGIQMLEHIANTQKVCFFCFEFTIESYLKRARVRNKDNMLIFNDGYDINTIAQNIKTLYKQGVKVFLIDSQMRITSPQGRNMEEEESLKFSTLARLCHSLKILVFLIVQTSKGDRDNPMGSKKGGHESSITIRIERTPPPKDTKYLSEYDEFSRLVIVKKNKQTGRHFSEKVLFDPKTCTFSNPNFKPNKDAQKISKEEVMQMIGVVPYV